MKIKTIISVLAILILACSITAIAAEDIEYSGHTFEIPEGYTVYSSNESNLVLTQDDDHIIVVLYSDEISDSEDSIKSLESKGYKFIGEETYDAEGYEVTQQNYEKDPYTALSYSFKIDGEYCIISYTQPVDETIPEGSDNPITGILKTMN